MAIEVELPDGTVVEFPDGTDNATMEGALRRYSDAQSMAPRAPGSPAAPKADFSGVTSTVDTTASLLRRPLASSPTARPTRDYAGLAGRSITQGASGALDMLNSGMKMLPNMGLVALATDGLPGIRDAANVALTKAGVARPRTAGERVGSDIGEAVTGAALTLGAGGLAGSRFLTANPALQLGGAVTGGAAMGLTRERGGGPLA